MVRTVRYYRLGQRRPTTTRTRGKRYIKQGKKYMPMRISSQIHRFKRTYEGTMDITDGAGIGNFAGNGNNNGCFMLEDLINYTEFTNLFQQYRIKGIKMTFMPLGNTSYIGNTSYSLPQLGFVYDTDDANVLTTRSDYQQYNTLKEYRLDRPVRKWVVPKLSTSVYGGVTPAYSQMSNKKWITTATTDAQYYGCKWFVDPIITGTGEQTLLKLRIICTYYIECRDVK